jgi:hypothetical protein
MVQVHCAQLDSGPKANSPANAKAVHSDRGPDKPIGRTIITSQAPGFKGNAECPSELIGA